MKEKGSNPIFCGSLKRRYAMHCFKGMMFPWAEAHG